MNHSKVFLLVMSVWSACSVYADQATEAEHLARLAHEIELLQPLVQAAEAQADYPARFRFQYPWLKQDLAKIRQGILDHLQPPADPPRQMAPLAGDYRR